MDGEGPVPLPTRGRGCREGGWVLTALLLMVLSGCQTLGLESVGRVSLTGGEYRGYLWVEGDPIPGSLTLTPRGSAVRARLTSEAGVQGSGEGEIAGRQLVLRIPYRTSCDGTIVFQGEVVSDGGRFVGNFTADDCTGSTSGRFDFRLP